MDLPGTWNNYKSLLAIIGKNEESLVEDFLRKKCSPMENLTNSRKLTQLFNLAVVLKNCQVVSVLLQYGVRGKLCEELFMYTPMQCAVRSGYVSLCMEMVMGGASFSEVDSNGNTLLHLAIMNKNVRWEKVSVSYSRKLAKSETEAVVIGMLKILLDLGLNVDAQNEKGETPLSLAVQYRMKEVTECLMMRNASLSIFGKSVTHFLIMDEVECLRRQERNTSLYQQAQSLWTKHQRSDFMHWWFSKRLDVNSRSDYETPLELCMRHGVKSVVEVLLKYTDDIHQTDNVGRSLLHILFASMENLLRVQENCDIESANDIAKMLIERGVSVDRTDRRGNTPFHIAAKLKRPEILQTILGHFTAVNARNTMNETALHVVTMNCSDKYEEEYIRIVGELIGKGADINCQDRYGKTPLYFVCQKTGSVFEKIAQLLLDRDCDVNVKDEHGVTALHLAIRMSNVEFAEALIAKGADVNCRETIRNCTPLHDATARNFPSVVESLLKAGAQPDVRDILGKTPLYISVLSESASTEITSLLLTFEADVEVMDSIDNSPLRLALTDDNDRKVELLLDYGARVTGIERLKLMPRRLQSNSRSAKTVLIKHLVAQAAAGLYVQTRYAVVVQRAQREWASFYEQVKQELDLLKNTMIEGDVTVYDMLHMNLRRRYRYTSKDSFAAFATDYGYLKNKFPIYRHIIAGTYWMAARRKPLLDLAKVAWYHMPIITLPDICVEQILDYLKNADLKFIIEVGL